MGCLAEFPPLGRTAEDIAERTRQRARELLAILDAIDAGELLCERPQTAAARLRHQMGISLLSVMRRDLVALCEELSSA